MILEKQLKELQSLYIVTKVCNIFFMDFITSLPESIIYKKRYNAIFLIVDKL